MNAHLVIIFQMRNYQFNFSCFLHAPDTSTPTAIIAIIANAHSAKMNTLFGRLAQQIRKPAAKVNRKPAKPHIPR